METPRVYQGVGDVDKKRIGCMLCGHISKYSGNTTNLNDHMRRKQATMETVACTVSAITTASDTEPTQPSSKQTLNAFFDAKLSRTSTRSKAITSSITQFIVKDLRPYRVVDNEGFKNRV